MTTFAYTAIDADAGGAVVKGTATAESAQAARESLRSRGLIVLSIAEEGAGRAWARLGEIRRGRRIRPGDTEWFFQTLRRLLDAKAPIEESMRTMVELAPTAPARAACERALEGLRAGEPLAQAVERTPGLARPQHLALLRVGHESGRLDHAVGLIERSIRARRRIRRTVTGKLIYPAIVAVASIGAVWVLAAFVIPRFAETLAQAGAELPLPTRITMASATWLMWLLPPLMIGVVALIAVRPASLPTRWRRRLDALLLRAPIAGDLVRLSQGAVIAETLATMLEGGGDILAGLEQARGATTSPSIAGRLERATRAVREGGEVGQALHEQRVLPPQADALVRIGARSGDLAGSLKQAAALCVEEQEATADRLLTLMGPAIILVLATLVGWIVYSLIAGMLSINDISALG